MDVYQRRRLVALSAIAAVFILIVLLIRSCGDDDETGTPLATGTSVPGAAEPLSQEDYIAQADAICQQTNVSFADVDAADAQQAATEEAELLASELAQLQSLSSPTDGEDKLNKFLDALQTQVQALDDLVKATERGTDTTELETTIAEAEADAAQAARRFGFEFCGDLEAVGETSADGGQTDEDVPDDTATTPVAPATTTTVPVTPPAGTDTDVGGVGTAPPTDTTPPADTGTDTGGTDPGSGGVSP